MAVWGDDEEALLSHAVAAVARVVLGRSPALRPTETAPLADWPSGVESRLVRAANEAVFQLLHRRRLPIRLRGDRPPVLELAPLPAGVRPEVEVKAATYHDLRVRRRAGRLTAVLTLDL